MLRNISADDACKTLYDISVTRRVETVSITESFLRVVSEKVLAKIPVPPFDRSPYDGYAFRGEDTSSATRTEPVVLKITEDIPAGTHPQYEITSGYAAKILTGAPIPAGADSTIKYENTEYSNNDVKIITPITPNTDIVYAGSDVKPGDEIAPEGAVITAPIISSLANQGFTNVQVFKKPVITVISTGSELCEVGEDLRPAAIYNSNVHTLTAYLSGVGAKVVNGGIAPDNPLVIAARIDQALRDSDMVITTGGASVGDYDWAVESMEQLEAKILFWKTNLRPGGAIVTAVKNGKVILGLSGNPGAAVTGLFRIAMPFIKKLCGMADCFFPEIDVMLKEAYKKNSPKLRILRGRLEIIDSRAYFAESSSQGSEAISSFTGCDLLGEIPMGSPPLPAGSVIKAYMI